MRKSHWLLMVLGLGLYARAAQAQYSGTYFIELCDSLTTNPSALTPFFGPARLLAPADVKALLKLIYATPNTLVSKLPKASPKMPPSQAVLEASIRENGGFLSSPYSPTGVKAVEKLGKACVMLASGGVSFTVLKATRKEAVIPLSEDDCLGEARALRKGEPGIDDEDEEN